MRRIALLPLVAVLAACASTAVQHSFVAPTNETVRLTSEEGNGPAPAHTIYAENHSTVPVTVYGFSLTDCENVRDSCTPHKLDVKLAPGARRAMSRVEPRDKEKGFTYRYSFSWRADSSNTTGALGALAASGVEPAKAELQAIRRAEAERAEEVGGHEMDLSARELVALAPRIARVRVEPDSLVLRIGERAVLHRQARLIAIADDGTRLGRVWGYRWRMMHGAVSLVPPDTITADMSGRSVIEFTLPDTLNALRGAPLPPVDLPVVVHP